MNEQNFETLRDDYITSLKVLNRSDVTINELYRKLGKFFEYLNVNDITRIEQVAENHIKGWQVELYQQVNAKGKPNCIQHQNKMMAAVKQFFRFLVDEGFVATDPTKDIQYAKEPKTLPKSIFTKSEARKILHAPNTNCVFGYRDRTILEVLYSTAIRNKELCNLTLEDVDYHDGYLCIINGKGGKDRVVPLGKIACQYLENYILSVRNELVKDPYNRSLFLTSRGNTMNSDTLWSLVKKYARLAGIKKNVYPHTFRHSCATGMLRNKANIRVIQELLGHAFLNTTQIYAHVSITDLKDVHKKCHPREREDN